MPKTFCSNEPFFMCPPPLYFRIATPELCLLRFVVYDVDMFGEPNFIGHYTIPVKCALDGVRSVPLKNTFSEELELAGQSYSYVNVAIRADGKSQVRQCLGFCSADS